MGRNKLVEDADVLAAARALFREVGHAASTRDVAEAAGISQGVLFQRFGTKDELFFRAMTSEAPDLDALFGPYPPRDGFESLVGIGERLAAYLRDFLPTLLKVLAHPGADVERLRAWHGALPFVPIVSALGERFRRMKDDGLMEGGDPHASAVAFMSAIHSLVFFELMTTDHERRHKGVGVRAQIAVLWRGLEPRGAGAVEKRRTKGCGWAHGGGGASAARRRRRRATAGGVQSGAQRHGRTRNALHTLGPARFARALTCFSPCRSPDPLVPRSPRSLRASDGGSTRRRAQFRRRATAEAQALSHPFRAPIRWHARC